MAENESKDTQYRQSVKYNYYLKLEFVKMIEGKVLGIHYVEKVGVVVCTDEGVFVCKDQKVVKVMFDERMTVVD